MSEIQIRTQIDDPEIFMTLGRRLREAGASRDIIDRILADVAQRGVVPDLGGNGVGGGIAGTLLAERDALVASMVDQGVRRDAAETYFFALAAGAAADADNPLTKLRQDLVRLGSLDEPRALLDRDRRRAVIDRAVRLLELQGYPREKALAAVQEQAGVRPPDPEPDALHLDIHSPLSRL